jgi:hypothetical protein
MPRTIAMLGSHEIMAISQQEKQTVAEALELVDVIARMSKDMEEGHPMENDDAVDALENLISQAREITGYDPNDTEVTDPEDPDPRPEDN